MNAAHGILTQRGPRSERHHHLPRTGKTGSTLDNPVIGDIASAPGKSPAQVMLRWGLQQGRSVIPKST